LTTAFPGAPLITVCLPIGGFPENKSNHCQDHADAASESMRMSHLELLTRPLLATLKV
jgi:hypothetical protein